MSWHYKRYTHNKELFEHLCTVSPKYLDWEVVALFYAALHLVNDYFERNGHAMPKNHNTRNKMIRRHLSDLKDEYNVLYGLSIRARYKELKITEKDRDKA